MSLIEVAVLFVAVGFFVVAAAPLFSRFLRTRTSVDYTLQATVLAQDIMERIRGKSFSVLKNELGREQRKTVPFSNFRVFPSPDPLYRTGESLPLLPTNTEVYLKIEKKGEDMLLIEIEISWPEMLKILETPEPTGTPGSDRRKRTYRLVTYVYEKGIRTLR